ncbi:unnamed protein product [Phyllotreta striolata]|uniref:Uncharacterized protein n=1 Tax=Phyllotreta striolata TaxID=444603 RepID=A0A9N9TXE6_PHYSR|nr:unnamed protein product [Phyllotreta striolata]
MYGREISRDYSYICSYLFQNLLLFCVASFVFIRSCLFTNNFEEN